MKLCIRLSVVALLVAVSISAFAQNPITTDAPFQIRYAANLNIADSVANITNSGASGSTNPICANVYTFSPDDQMVSCCSCQVTPNGLVSLSAKKDLISNTLTSAVPTSIVIKLLATSPVGGGCNAGGVASATLVPGMLAWGTTIHPLTTKTGRVQSTSYAVTETPFSPATLSASELAKIGSLCSFIMSNGGGFGICSSCRVGALVVTH